MTGILGRREKFRREVEGIVADSLVYSHSKGNRYLTLEHFFAVLVRRREVARGLDAESPRSAGILADLDRHLECDPSADGGARPLTTPSTRKLIKIAAAKADFAACVGDVVFAMLFTIVGERNSYAMHCCRRHGVTAADIRGIFGIDMDARSARSQIRAMERGVPARPPAGRRAVSPGSFLGRFCREAGEPENPLVGRREEMESLIEAISRCRKNNALLVGEPGVGKTAIVEGLAARLEAGRVPKALRGARMFQLDPVALVAGTRYRGDLEERADGIMKEIAAFEGAILVVDDIHSIAGGSDSSLAALFRPLMKSGGARVVGTTTPDSFRRRIEREPAISRGFLKIPVEEPSRAESKRILRQIVPRFEKFHGVKLEAAAIGAAVDLCAEFVHSRRLPDKAADAVDAAMARHAATPGSGPKAGVRAVEEACARMANVPLETMVRVRETGRNSVDVGKAVGEAVFGQDEAVQALSDAVCVSLAGLKEGTRPMGSFLFAGPTGVGKTETARRLAECLDMKLRKFDMTECQEAHSVSRLIGSPPGYVGYGDGGAGAGALVSALETHPNSVILLDEIEKAHPKILDVLLQVMDDGRLTSSSGKEVSARSAILIMTSNAGAADAEGRNRIGFGDGDGDPGAEIQSEAVKRAFSPEFRNRLDSVVMFRSLGKDAVRRIAVKFLKDFAATAKASGVSVKWTAEAADWLADRGFDPKMGARPMRRALDRHIRVPLSRMMLHEGLEGKAEIRVKDGEVAIA